MSKRKGISNMSKKIDPYELYLDMLKDFFTSRGYTDEQAISICGNTKEIQRKLLELENIKIQEELKNVIENLKIWKQEN